MRVETHRQLLRRQRDAERTDAYVRFLRQIDRQFFDDLAQQAAQQSWLEAAAECGQGDAFAVRRIDLAAGKRVVTGERAEERLALHHQQFTVTQQYRGDGIDNLAHYTSGSRSMVHYRARSEEHTS